MTCKHKTLNTMRGMCISCYRKQRREGTLPKKGSQAATKTCACGVEVQAKGMCNTCYNREWKRGKEKIETK